MSQGPSIPSRGTAFIKFLRHERVWCALVPVRKPMG